MEKMIDTSEEVYIFAAAIETWSLEDTKLFLTPKVMLRKYLAHTSCLLLLVLLDTRTNV